MPTVLQSNINSAAAQAAGIRLPYPGFTGNVAQALRKYPQYQNIAWRGVPVGESQYHAVETVLERRFSRGLQARVAYTFSKLHNNGSENAQGSDGANAVVQNPADPLEWSLSADDTPHVFLVGFTWEVPGSESWSSGVAKALLAGWNVSGVLRYESGRPFNIMMANDLGGFLFNGQKRPNRVGRRRRRDRDWRLRSQHRSVLQSELPGRIRVRSSSGTLPGVTPRCADSRTTARI